MDSRIRQTPTASPAKPGSLPLTLAVVTKTSASPLRKCETFWSGDVFHPGHELCGHIADPSSSGGPQVGISSAQPGPQCMLNSR